VPRIGVQQRLDRASLVADGDDRAEGQVVADALDCVVQPFDDLGVELVVQPVGHPDGAAAVASQQPSALL
jgi:hypothetical protein